MGVAAARPPVLPLPGENGPVILGRHAEFMEDPDGRLTVDDIRSGAYDGRFAAGRSDVENFGFSPSAYWVKFILPAGTAQTQQLLLELSWPVLDRVEFFYPVDGDRYASRIAGDRFPWATRDFKHHNLVFSVPLRPGRESTYYLRVQSEGTISLPMRLWTIDAFATHDRDAQLLYGLFYGLAIALALYNLLLYAMIRDPAYLYYVCYAVPYGIFLAMIDGHAFQYLWPGSVWAANDGLPILGAISGASVAQFVRTFLGTSRTAPLADHVLRVLIAVDLLLVLVTAVGWPIGYAGSLRALTITALVFVVVAFAAGGKALWRGYRPARYYMLASAAILIAVLLFTLRNLAILPHNALTVQGVYVGYALELVLLSLALGDRFNAMKREAELAHTEARAMEIASRHKSEFLANMSHELRTPLNAILGFSEMLRERYFGDLTAKQAEYVDDIREAGSHLLSLINDILDLSKVEAGRMELELSEFDLAAAIDNAVTLIKERAARHGISVQKHVDPALAVIRADERKLKQILLNLLSNAVKFTPDGGRIAVSASRNGRAVEVAVSDTGIGIAAQDQVAVFEEFKQVGNDRLRKAEGTGLGLALAKRFVELHGGTIRVESVPGKGSTFVFSIPAD